jgi:uncharacterized protein YjiS (DUF1127 family)
MPASAAAKTTARSPARLAPRVFLGWFCRAYDRYLQRRALAELDDRLLADIGVTRAEARRECAVPLWRFER